MKIVLIDGRPNRRRRLQRLLRRLGCAVSEFATADLAHPVILSSAPAIVIADGPTRSAEGFGLFRKLQAAAERGDFYLIALGEPPGSGPGADRGPGEEADDLLDPRASARELLARLQMARRSLARRQAESGQIQRLERIPAESPHPILELTATGDLLHANLASLPLLEAWGWALGLPAPPPFRHLAGTAIAAAKPRHAEVPCGDRIYSFFASPTEEKEVCLYGHDVTEAAAAARESEAAGRQDPMAARRDALTGLPTRVLLLDRLAPAVAHARAAGSRVALVKVGIDNCSNLNDVYGRSLGDHLITIVGGCLREETGPGDTVFRDQGDGFVLLLTGTGTREAVGATCRGLMREAQEAGRVTGLGIRFTISLGFALFPDDADTETLLLERAGQALTEAKNCGRDCWRDYTDAVQSNPLLGEARLLPRLLNALQSRQLQAHYQPLITASTGTVAGFEALVRWHDPALGWVAPDRFIPIAEARGLIAEVGRQMADLVVRQLAAWRSAGHAIRVSLNLSRGQLGESGFGDGLLQRVREHQLSPDWLVLEATERQSLLHDRVCREALQQLADHGFRLSLDDFGSGHSNLEMISELPFRELKLNMALSRRTNTPGGRPIVKAIIGMCHDLGLESVAEGIEDLELDRSLRQLKVSLLQGYLYSAPLRAEATLPFLERHAAFPFTA